MNRKVFIEKLTAQMRVWDAQIEELEAKAAKVKTRVAADYQKQIKDLRDKKQEAQTKLYEVKQSSEEAWDELKSGAENAFDSIKEAFLAAKLKF